MVSGRTVSTNLLSLSYSGTDIRCGVSSGYLRQTIMLSAYETPQIRALFNNTKLLKNVSGRVRQARRYGAALIPEGIVTVSSGSHAV